MLPKWQIPDDPAEPYRVLWVGAKYRYDIPDLQLGPGEDVPPWRVLEAGPVVLPFTESDGD